MSADAVASHFYKLGCQSALAKLSACLRWPEDETFQYHRETGSPSTNGPEGSPNDRADYTQPTTSDVWTGHDRLMNINTLPETFTHLGV